MNFVICRSDPKTIGELNALADPKLKAEQAHLMRQCSQLNTEAAVPAVSFPLVLLLHV
jgi:hypothetical protein